jgi:hypothetical protein
MRIQPMDGRRYLGPLRSRAPWVAWGLLVQVLGAGSLAVVLWRQVRNQGVGAHITAEMLKLARRSELHLPGAGGARGRVHCVRLRQRRDGTAVHVEPVRSFVAVPAVAGLLVLGVLAAVLAAVAAVIANTQGDVDLGIADWVPRRRDRRR